MSNEAEKQERLLKHVGALLEAMIAELEYVDSETVMKIMEKCGRACAYSDGDLELAKNIADETIDLEEILSRVNAELLWCGKWTKKGNTIKTTCFKCGCPLVRNHVVKLTGTLCYCSRGWVKSIFEVLLKRPVTVELEKSIGRGDKICKLVAHF